MTVAAIGVGVAGAAISAGASAYSQSQQRSAAKKAQSAANAAAAQGQTTTQEMPAWLQPYAKAYLERQWLDSSKPYQEYGGFFQNMGKAMHEANAPQPHPWDSLFGPGANDLPGKTNGNVPAELAFRQQAGIPYNPLTARQGETPPLPLTAKDYGRYLASLANPGSNTLEAIGGQDAKAWKKQNKFLKKYMDQPLMMGSASKYNGLLQNQVTDMQNEQKPSIFDQMYYKNILR